MLKIVLLFAFVFISNIKTHGNNKMVKFLRTTTTTTTTTTNTAVLVSRNTSESMQLYSIESSTPDLMSSTNMDYLLTLYVDIKFWRQIFICVGACITIIGITLNTLCIYIFYRTKLFQNSSFPYYVYVLAIVDTLNLIIRYVVPQSTESIVHGILHAKYNATTPDEYEMYTSEIVSDYHCNVLMYIHNTLGFASTWIMAAVSAERFLVIKYPLQSKKLIKLRAFVILISIVLVVMLLNTFDLASDFYSKPQWFSNLTLFCEPQDTASSVKFAFVSFNADALSFARTLLQAVVPFLVALYFNSLIIHNFKRIKMAAHQRFKSQSTASVMSHSSNCCSKQQISSAQVINLKGDTKTLAIPNSHLYGSTLAPPSHDSTYGSQTNLSCVTTTTPHHSPNKYSFRRRLSKLKLNRETDIMLIVLSFSILFTQLPCTITWYLIYYRLILTYINDIYLAARSPILLYILRLVEMLYFSMNFIFYIALSPSLRRELNVDKDRLVEKFLCKKSQPIRPTPQVVSRAHTPCTPLITCKLSKPNSITHKISSESQEKLRKNSSSLSSCGSVQQAKLLKGLIHVKSRKLKPNTNANFCTQTPKIIINHFNDDAQVKISIDAPPPPITHHPQYSKTQDQKSCYSICSLAYIDGVEQSTIHDANETFK